MSNLRGFTLSRNYFLGLRLTSLHAFSDILFFIVPDIGGRVVVLIWLWRHRALGRSLVKLMLGIAMGGSGLMWPNYEG